MKKHIVFACSSGIATSTVVAEKVVEHCKDHGIDVVYQQAIIGELPSLDNTVDLFVATSQVETKLNTPLVNALPIITGFGEEEVLDNIITLLKG
ncbi:MULTISPECIES: PTS sugar transporter subunit IIB [Priestia]|uniref:PTS sugar transporter subunit IIB n=1 Tax=Priestia TaxID=2800373 RepID=UPI0012D8E535|nr:PTS sugar transporter subunit IIB [Priestia megaterium]MUL34051.1 Galactitol-specific phosphotransferase enzyme IIB component [Priestia megaterium]